MLHLHAIQPEEERWITMRDFNSHSPSWGYPDLDPKGDEVEDWTITNQMVLINRPDKSHTYYSRAWRKTSCPDISIAADDVTKMTEHHVKQQLGGSDHKPVLLVIKQDLCQAGRKLCPSWNYKEQTGQNFIKRQMKTAENWRWNNITWMEKWTYSQKSLSVLPKKQFPEEGGQTTSQAGMHSFGNSIVLSADSERRWNPAQQMIT